MPTKLHLNRQGQASWELRVTARDRAVPSPARHHPAALEEQSRDGGSDQGLAQPRNVCPQMRAASRSTTRIPVPGVLAALRALASPGQDLHHLCWLRTPGRIQRCPEAKRGALC